MPEFTFATWFQQPPCPPYVQPFVHVAIIACPYTIKTAVRFKLPTVQPNGIFYATLELHTVLSGQSIWEEKTASSIFSSGEIEAAGAK